jgi:hypothetical protein
MSRDTSLIFRQAINAVETDQVFVTMLEIADTALVNPAPAIRVCNDSVDTSGPGGYTYLSYNFDVKLPDDTDDSAPTCKIVIDNIARELTEGIRNLTTPPLIKIMVVLASTPTVIEAQYTDFKLTNITYDALTIEGNISIEDYASEPFPGDSFIPSTCPGLF